MNRLSAAFFLICFFSAFCAFAQDGSPTQSLVEPIDLSHPTEVDPANTLEHSQNYDPSKLDRDLIDAFGITAGYEYHFEPDFRQGYYLRQDAWTIKWNPQDQITMMGGQLFPLFANLTKSSKIQFIRHFQRWNQALTAIPKTIFDLPLTANEVLKKMRPGEVVAIPQTTTLLTGAQFAFVEGSVGENGNLAYLVEGEFVYQFFMTDASHFRFRVYANRQHGPEEGASVASAFTVTGLSIMDGVVKGVIDFNLADIFHSDTGGNILLVDYIFDLSQASARDALDAIIHEVYQFKDASLALQVFRNGSINQHVANLALADELAAAGVGSANPAVQRLFCGTNAYASTTTKADFSILIAKWRKQDSFADNFIAAVDAAGSPEFFYNPSFVETTRSTWLWLSQNERLNIFGVLNAGPTPSAPESFRNLGVSVDDLDDVISKDSQRVVRNRLYRMLPDRVFNQIDWKGWGWADPNAAFHHHTNWRVYLQLAVSADAIRAAEALPKDELERRIIAQLSRSYGPLVMTGEPDPDLVLDDPDNDGDRVQIDLENPLALARVADEIYSILHNSSFTESERIDRLMDLRKNGLYRKYSVGFFTALLNDDQVAADVHVELSMFASKTDVVGFRFGTDTATDDAIFNELHLIDATSDWQKIDTRLFIPIAQ